jgi:4-methyl-5(b-hydroxyethyl)-thiazole monophosphate biosynthesis
MNKTALVILAPGFEEIEAITVIDVLRRAQFDVITAGTMSGPLVASRQTRHLADTDIDQVRDTDFDIVILPGGGEGTANLKKDARVHDILKQQKKKLGWIGAICAAPTVLHEHGLLDPEQKLICHPGEQKNIPAEKLQAGQRVVVSGKLITSLAAGSAMEFAYAIIEQLAGPETVRKVNEGICARI